MNISTAVFTAVTSGYYIVTFSANVEVHAGGYTYMYLYHNEVQVEESLFEVKVATSEQGSRTVVNIVFNC